MSSSDKPSVVYGLGLSEVEKAAGYPPEHSLGAMAQVSAIANQ